MKYSFADLQKVIDKRGGMSYHDSIREAKSKNIAAFIEKGNAARASADEGIEDFLNTVRDYKLPGHERALAQYKNVYNRDASAVKKDFHAKARAKFGVPADGNEEPNENKLSSLLTQYTLQENGCIKNIKYRPKGDSNSDDTAAYNKFKDYINKFVQAFGFEGAEDAVADFWQDNYMSQFADNPAPSVKAPSGGKLASY